MRSEREAEMALECLRISQGCIRHAEQMLAFVTGKAVDDAQRKLDAVAAVVSAEHPGG